MKRLTALPGLLLVATSVLVVGASPAQAAGPVFKATGVSSFGCDNGAIHLVIEASDFGSGEFVFHTRALVDGKLYMDQGFAQEATNGTDSWSIFDDLSYGQTYGGTTAPIGTFPMPAGKPVTIYLEVERPHPTTVSRWKIVLDGCDTGAIVSNAVGPQDDDGDLVNAPTDVCDGLYSPAGGDGCPVIKRTLKVAYGKKGVLRGALQMPVGARVYNGVIGDVKLTLFKKGSKGSGKHLVTFWSRPNGKFRVPIRLAKGKYFVSARGSVDPDYGRAKIQDKSFTVK